MQSKVDNPESFNWFLKTLQEEEKKQHPSGERPGLEFSEEVKKNVLRFVKVLSPTVTKLLEVCRAELDLSLLATTLLLDELEKAGDIEIVDAAAPANVDTSSSQVSEKIVKITEHGLKKL